MVKQYLIHFPLLPLKYKAMLKNWAILWAILYRNERYFLTSLAKSSFLKT